MEGAAGEAGPSTIGMRRDEQAVIEGRLDIPPLRASIGPDLALKPPRHRENPEITHRPTSM